MRSNRIAREQFSAWMQVRGLPCARDRFVASHGCTCVLRRLLLITPERWHVTDRLQTRSV